MLAQGLTALAAAIRLARQGLNVKIFEASSTIGGGMRTKELMQPGFHHDICSAIHPLAASSPYLKHLPLDKFGLEWITPDFPVAHPMDGGTAVVMHHNINQTMDELGADGAAYRTAMEPISDNWDTLTADFLGPLRFPKHPINLARFGLKALQPAVCFKNGSNMNGRKLCLPVWPHTVFCRLVPYQPQPLGWCLARRVTQWGGHCQRADLNQLPMPWPVISNRSAAKSKLIPR